MIAVVNQVDEQPIITHYSVTFFKDAYPRQDRLNDLLELHLGHALS